MSSRVYYSEYGLTGPYKLPAYAMRQPGERPVDAVRRAIENKLGFSVQCRPEGREVAWDGTILNDHYELTLYYPRSGNFRRQETRFWVWIPREDAHPTDISESDLWDLYTEAGQAGDLEQVALCNRALFDDDPEARRLCADAITKGTE